jgi:hypothetical protein
MSGLKKKNTTSGLKLANVIFVSMLAHCPTDLFIKEYGRPSEV